MVQQIHRRHVGDTTKTLNVRLWYVDENDNTVYHDLTSLLAGAITFRMMNAATDAYEIAETATGVTFTADDQGNVVYDFSDAGVDTAGIYYGWFEVTESAETCTYPRERTGLRIEIDSDTQTAQEAYDAAVAAL